MSYAHPVCHMVRWTDGGDRISWRYMLVRVGGFVPLLQPGSLKLHDALSSAVKEAKDPLGECFCRCLRIGGGGH